MDVLGESCGDMTSIPLLASAQPAGSHQQVMSPTLGQGNSTTGVTSSVSAGGAETDGPQTTFGIGAPSGLEAGSSGSVLDGGDAIRHSLATGRARGDAEHNAHSPNKQGGEQDPPVAEQKTPGGSLGPRGLGAPDAKSFFPEFGSGWPRLSETWRSFARVLTARHDDEAPSVSTNLLSPRFGMEANHACSDQGLSRGVWPLVGTGVSPSEGCPLQDSLGGAQAEVPIASLPGRDGLPEHATVVAPSRADSPAVCANVCSATPAGRPGAQVQGAQVQGPNPAAMLAGLPGAQAQGAQGQGPNPAAELAGLPGASQSAPSVPVGATNALQEPQVPSFTGSMPLPPQAQTPNPCLRGLAESDLLSDLVTGMNVQTTFSGVEGVWTPQSVKGAGVQQPCSQHAPPAPGRVARALGSHVQLIPGGVVAGHTGSQVAPSGFPAQQPLLAALTAGVLQLQGLQAQLTMDKGDNEVVKPGSPILPPLGPPEPANGSLIFQDWLELIHNPIRDLSNYSHVWWAHVLQVSREAYTRWCVASPLDRLSIEPQEQGSASGRWVRVNSRACGMILEALDPSVKAHILAHRATGVAACLLFRLFTMYQPGGGAERWLVLRSLQSPCLIQDVHSGVMALRDWGRWHRRCVECGMMVPDPMVLARALTEMTRGVLEGHSDAAFRMQCTRAVLRIDQHPSGEEVLTYHRHLLAEFETLALAQPEVSGGKVAEISNSGEQANKGHSVTQNEKPGLPTRKLCKFFVLSRGCRKGSHCEYAHDLSVFSAQDKANRCWKCGSKEHHRKDCRAGRVNEASPQLQPQVQEEPAAQDATNSTQATGPGGDTRRSEAAPQTPVLQPREEVQKGHRQDAGQVLPKLFGELVKAWCDAARRQESPQTPNPIPQMRSLNVHAQALALVDSGATHPLRQAGAQEEWDTAVEVDVSLGGNVRALARLTCSGTLLTPPGREGTQTIIPMGAVISRLGFRLSWVSDADCAFHHPDGQVIPLVIRRGCPYMCKHVALELIAQLEADVRHEGANADGTPQVGLCGSSEATSLLARNVEPRSRKLKLPPQHQPRCNASKSDKPHATSVCVAPSRLRLGSGKGCGNIRATNSPHDSQSMPVCFKLNAQDSDDDGDADSNRGDSTPCAYDLSDWTHCSNMPALSSPQLLDRPWFVHRRARLTRPCDVNPGVRRKSLLPASDLDAVS